MLSRDNDAIGVVFRYQNAQNYYRFSMDSQRGYQRLVKKVDGRYTLLAQVKARYTVGTSYRIRTRAIGRHLSVWLNDKLLFDVTDRDLGRGKVGLYSWGSASTVADDVSVDVRTGPYFTVAVVPDTQYTSQSHPGILRDQMEWLARSRARENIAMVLQEGDIVNHIDDAAQWAAAARYYDFLDGKVPFVAAVGNHDETDPRQEDRPLPIEPAPYNRFIGGFSDYTVDGAYKAGDYRNTYHLFSAGGVDLMVLNLEFGAPDRVLDWAGRVVDAHPARHVLLLTHDYLGQDNELRGRVDRDDRTLPHNYNPTLNNGIDIWRAFVRKHPNVQFTFNGHVNTPISDRQPYSVGRLVSENDAGSSVYQVLTNYQTFRPGGRGYLRLVRFYPAANKVTVSTYSPHTNTSLTDRDNDFQFRNVDLGTW
jgi:hypothetical protein